MIPHTPSFLEAIETFRKYAPGLSQLFDEAFLTKRQELKIRHMAENLQILMDELAPGDAPAPTEEEE